MIQRNEIMEEFNEAEGIIHTLENLLTELGVSFDLEKSRLLRSHYF